LRAVFSATSAVPLLKRVTRMLAADTDRWTDTTWVVDSTPVERARSREAVTCSASGRAGHGYRASHSRFCCGPRPHLVRTPAGPPVA